MAIEGKHMTDPTQRKKQVRAATWALIVFTAGTALSACGTTKPAAEAPAAATAEPQGKRESSAADTAEGQRNPASSNAFRAELRLAIPEGSASPN